MLPNEIFEQSNSCPVAQVNHAIHYSITTELCHIFRRNNVMQSRRVTCLAEIALFS